jgi:hypothetical protein
VALAVVVVLVAVVFVVVFVNQDGVLLVLRKGSQTAG